MPQARGELNTRAILSEADVRAIRASKLSQRKLAVAHGVHQSTIWKILNEKIWGQLDA